MNKRAGITLVSIVLYVAIFFALTILTSGVTMAMNSNSLQDKGKIYLCEAEFKLRNNLLSSLENSDSMKIINNKIIFSNEDVYSYDEDLKIIYKNGGIFIQNVKSCSFNIEQNINYSYLKFEAEIEKYNQSKKIKLDLFNSEV